MEMKYGDTGGTRQRSVMFYIYCCISIGGAAILAIEILGTRILGPFYGVSLYLWSALITVTLAALSLGYYIGGHLADRGASPGGLGVFFVASGIWMLIVPIFRGGILEALEPIGLRPAVLAGAVLLFFPPLMLLGMVSPYAIKLKTRTLGELGRSAGNLYAASTLASVAGALLTGYYFIPNIGISRLVILISILLLVTGAAAPLVKARSRAAFLVAIAAAVAVHLSFAGRRAEVEQPGLIAYTQSPYGEISVVDMNDTRYLLIDGAIHTEVDAETHRPLSAYVDVMDITRSFFTERGRMLLVGLGGGSIAMRFSAAGWSVDAVEIDPTVVTVAEDYFGFSDEMARVYEMDGRRYLEATPETYDVIVLDAFGSSYIPFHLVTREAFRLMSSRLKPDGLLAINVITLGWRSMVVRSISASLGDSFPHVSVLPIVEPPNRLGNVVILASRRDLEPLEEPPIPVSRFSADYNRFHAWENRFQPAMGEGMVLTDDRNPIDIWAERVNVLNRKRLHEFFWRESAG